MILDYARGSTADQSPELPISAPTAFGADRFSINTYTDTSAYPAELLLMKASQLIKLYTMYTTYSAKKKTQNIM